MRKRTRRLCLALGLVAGALAGCEQFDGPVATSPAAVDPSAQGEKAAAPLPSVEDPTFALTLADAGEAGLALTLEARGGYHINQEFPFSAKLSSDTASFAKSELTREDASEFGELSATFPVAAELPAGDHEIVADVRFAVCTEETCIPDQRTLTLQVHR